MNGRWKVGDAVHSAGTGLAMTVREVMEDGRIVVWHHADQHMIVREPGSVYACRGCRVHEPQDLRP